MSETSEALSTAIVAKGVAFGVRVRLVTANVGPSRLALRTRTIPERIRKNRRKNFRSDLS